MINNNNFMTRYTRESKSTILVEQMNLIYQYNNFNINSGLYNNAYITQKDLNAFVFAFKFNFGKCINHICIDTNTGEMWYTKKWDDVCNMFGPNEDFISDRLELPIPELYFVAHCAAYYGKDAALDLCKNLLANISDLNELLAWIAKVIDEGINIYDGFSDNYYHLKLN